MFYLSKLELNPKSRQVWSELKNPYELHRTLSRAFGKEKEECQLARCLYRIEPETDRQKLHCLVQSKTEPDWEYLNEGYVRQPLLKREFQDSDLVRVFKAGRVLKFKLRANPTVCKNGKRVSMWEVKPDIETHDQRLDRIARIEARRSEWLVRKAEMSGFTALEFVIDTPDSIDKISSNAKQMLFDSVDYEGVLRVDEPALFLKALENGIGSGKAYGFGLLSVGRA